MKTADLKRTYALPLKSNSRFINMMREEKIDFKDYAWQYRYTRCSGDRNMVISILDDMRSPMPEEKKTGTGG